MPINELTNSERKKILDSVDRIHSHKLMQAKGFGILAKKTKNEHIKQILLRLSTDEGNQAEFWFERIRELGGKREGAIKRRIRNWKVGFIMRILGSKGFFEWTVVGEEESIRDLALHAEIIKDAIISETYSRMVSDERMHLEKIKSEILGMKSWEMEEGGGVREMILGANDGLVSTLAFVFGVFGAYPVSFFILLSGIAELVAGTISMGAGAYQSTKSEMEVLERESAREKVKKGKTPEDKREELIKFYLAEGFKRGEAEAIVDRISKKEEAYIKDVDLEDLGLSQETRLKPGKAGFLCGIFFALAALVPILPFIFPIPSWQALIISTIATITTLFGVGAMKTIFSRKNWIRSGLEMMIIGASAAGVTYLIGRLFSLIIG